MIHKILADLTVALHLAWIVFLFLGAFWGLRSRRVKLFHLFGLGFALLVQVFDWYCPLTHLEVYFRSRHNPDTSYSGDFVIRYLEKMVYLQVPRYIVVGGTILLAGINLIVYRGLLKVKEEQNEDDNAGPSRKNTRSNRRSGYS